MDRKSGIARTAYRTKMDDREMMKVFRLDFISLSGIVSPIRIKLKMLKRVPRRNPFPISVRFAKKQSIHTRIATVKAQEQYLF